MNQEKINSISLDLFNCVLKGEVSAPVFLEGEGVFMPKDAAYAQKQVAKHAAKKRISGEDLNKTFHKSWQKVVQSTRLELALHQILHYLTRNLIEGDGYLPAEVLNIPELKLHYVTVKAVSTEQLIADTLTLLESGVAMKPETVEKCITLLELLNYTFANLDNIKNKEALIVIADKTGVMPSAPEDLLRLAVFRATGEALLIKSPEVIGQIKDSNVDFYMMAQGYDLAKLAQIFNRFKPLFLALKDAHVLNPNTINRISKLSNKHHVGLVTNPLNQVTNIALKNEDMHWLENATFYALAKALNACHTRLEGQTDFVYQVRNGKSWAKSQQAQTLNDAKREIWKHNYLTILEFMKTEFNGNGKSVFIPEGVKYAVPTSEKMFVGDIPTGTKFVGKGLSVGVYWENRWGARDIDLSALNISGKIGWNSDYYDEDQTLVYSGDRTDAYEGAAEYMRVCGDDEIAPSLIQTSIYDGENTAGYKIIVALNSNPTYDHMCDPNKVIAAVKTESIQRNTVLGMVCTEDNGDKSFTIMNVGAGKARVSSCTESSQCYTNALYQSSRNALDLEFVLCELGFDVVRVADGADVDLSVREITAAKFIKLFESSKVSQKQFIC